MQWLKSNAGTIIVVLVVMAGVAFLAKRNAFVKNIFTA